MYSLTTSVLSLSLLSSTVHAQSIARVWTHFYPNCPGEPFTKLDTYENYHESTPPQDIEVGSCKNFAVPSYEHNLVRSISVDAELLSHDHDLPFMKGDSGCNITVHQVPECIDPPLISQEIRDGVVVSQCEPREFVAYSQVWINLVCDSDSPLHSYDSHTPSQEEQQTDTRQSLPTNKPNEPLRAEKQTTAEDINNIQTPGSNSDSWRLAQTTQNQREPAQEERVNNAGHAQSQQKVEEMIGMLKSKTSTLVSEKKYNSSHYLDMLRNNGTTPGNHTVMSRRRLSVLRNRLARLA
ncbi:hypothetical protein N7475_006486 [Penicillium sp. IBT 31633x]|nr:hypothetical protein N7475_006486 [Penicillium sp. IBT 31633x]